MIIETGKAVDINNKVDCCIIGSNIAARRVGEYDKPELELYCKICGETKTSLTIKEK